MEWDDRFKNMMDNYTRKRGAETENGTTANDIIGNLRMFVNCNLHNDPKNIYMAKDTFDAVCSIFESAYRSHYPYDLGRSSKDNLGATIFGLNIVIREELLFGAVAIGDLSSVMLPMGQLDIL